MFQQMAQQMASSMLQAQEIESSNIRIYVYGFELLLSSLAGVLALMIVSVACGMPFSWIPYLIGFVPLRLSGGGYHAKTHRSCILIFSMLYTVIGVVEKVITIPYVVWLVSSLATLIISILFSPLMLPNKPLRIEQQKNNRRMHISLILMNMLGCIAIILLHTGHVRWLNMYFAGSGMAGLSMLMAVIKQQGREEQL